MDARNLGAPSPLPLERPVFCRRGAWRRPARFMVHGAARTTVNDQLYVRYSTCSTVHAAQQYVRYSTCNTVRAAKYVPYYMKRHF